MQVGSVQSNNHLPFAKHNNQGDGERTAKIYKNSTCYKYGQLGHYIGSCPFKEDKQEKLKEKGSSPDNKVQGINHVTTCISSIHLNHEVDESNGDTEYNFESDNESDNNSDPTPGACFHQASHHINNDTGRINPYWVLLDNQIAVHIFSNRALLENMQDADNPIDVYSSGGATHCSKAGTLKNIGEVYLHEN